MTSFEGSAHLVPFPSPTRPSPHAYGALDRRCPRGVPGEIHRLPHREPWAHGHAADPSPLCRGPCWST